VVTRFLSSASGSAITFFAIWSRSSLKTLPLPDRASTKVLFRPLYTPGILCYPIECPEEMFPSNAGHKNTGDYRVMPVRSRLPRAGFF
jgi:hypothetical protein